MSNAFVIHVLFIVGVFAVIGGCAYCVMYDDVYEKEESALEETFVELCGMFYSVGATFGVNYIGVWICKPVRFDTVINTYVVECIWGWGLLCMEGWLC